MEQDHQAIPDLRDFRAGDDAYRDYRLRRIFTALLSRCCSTRARAAAVAAHERGRPRGDRARHCLLPAATIGQRIVRASAPLSEAG